MAVTEVLTPVLQKAEKHRFYQETGGLYEGTIIHEKIQSQLETFQLNAFLYTLKKHVCEEK